MNIRGIRTKRGGKININSVTRMLHNRKYIVEFKYRDIIQPNGSLTVFFVSNSLYLSDGVFERMKS